MKPFRNRRGAGVRIRRAFIVYGAGATLSTRQLAEWTHPRATQLSWLERHGSIRRPAESIGLVRVGRRGLQPALNIEKAPLPHDPLAPSAHDRARSSSEIRGDLARGIFRGALKVEKI